MLPVSPSSRSRPGLGASYPAQSMYNVAPQGAPLIPVAAVVMNDDPFYEMHGQPVYIGEEVKEPAPKEGRESSNSMPGYQGKEGQPKPLGGGW